MLSCNNTYQCQGQAKPQHIFTKHLLNDRNQAHVCNNNCKDHSSEQQTQNFQYEGQGPQSPQWGDQSPLWEDQSPQWDGQSTENHRLEVQSPEHHVLNPYMACQSPQSSPFGIQSPQLKDESPQSPSWEVQSPQSGIQSPQWESQSPPWGFRSPQWEDQSPQWVVRSPQVEGQSPDWEALSPRSEGQVGNTKWGLPSPLDTGVDAHWDASQSPLGESQSWQWQEEASSPEGLVVTRQQVREHNRQVGWQQWITLKGSVYHTTGFRDHFLAYNKKKAEEARREALAQSAVQDCLQTEGGCRPSQETEPHNAERMTLVAKDNVSKDEINQGRDRHSLCTSGSDESTDDDDTDDDDDGDDAHEGEQVDDNFLWQYDVLSALRKSGLNMAEIETEIRPFKIGSLRDLTFPKWKYWESIRNDAIALRDEISNKESSEVGKYEQDYLELLQRWLRKYMDMDPVEKHLGGDGNTNVFFLTQDPDSFREWTRTLPALDTQLPESGAWASTEFLLSPLADTHDVFSAALRSHHSDHLLLRHDIQGNVAWTELPQDVISSDQMTSVQQAVHEARERRGGCVHDPKRMKKSRERLGSYFQRKYGYSQEKMAKFLQWADRMERNEREFNDLCLADVWQAHRFVLSHPGKLSSSWIPLPLLLRSDTWRW